MGQKEELLLIILFTFHIGAYTQYSTLYKMEQCPKYIPIYVS